MHHILWNRHYGLQRGRAECPASQDQWIASLSQSVCWKEVDAPMGILGCLQSVQATSSFHKGCVNLIAQNRLTESFSWQRTSTMPKMPESGKSWSQQANDGSMRGACVSAWLTLMTAQCCAFTECFHFRRASKPPRPFKSSSFTAKPETIPMSTFSNNLCLGCRLY